jgi:AraC family transcriptional regulator
MHPASAWAIPGSTRFRAHEHDAPHLCVVLEGGFVERDGKTWRDVAPGTVRVSGAARHDIDFSARGATCLVLEPDPNAIAHLRSPRFIEHDQRLASLAFRIGRTSRSEHPVDRVLEDDLTVEFLAQVDRRLRGRAEPPPPWLARIRDIVHSDPHRSPMVALAEQAGVHRVHVARVFRDHYGVSVSTYARRIRVRKALRLLADTDVSLSELAYMSGYADQSHLTREIRRATGSTPAALKSKVTSVQDCGGNSR